jgi:hypothetical protein
MLHVSYYLKKKRYSFACSCMLSSLFIFFFSLIPPSTHHNFIDISPHPHIYRSPKQHIIHRSHDAINQLNQPKQTIPQTATPQEQKKAPSPIKIPDIPKKTDAIKKLLDTSQDLPKTPNQAAILAAPPAPGPSKPSQNQQTSKHIDNNPIIPQNQTNKHENKKTNLNSVEHAQKLQKQLQDHTEHSYAHEQPVTHAQNQSRIIKKVPQARRSSWFKQKESQLSNTKDLNNSTEQAISLEQTREQTPANQLFGDFLSTPSPFAKYHSYYKPTLTVVDPSFNQDLSILPHTILKTTAVELELFVHKVHSALTRLLSEEALVVYSPRTASIPIEFDLIVQNGFVRAYVLTRSSENTIFDQAFARAMQTLSTIIITPGKGDENAYAYPFRYMVNFVQGTHRYTTTAH